MIIREATPDDLDLVCRMRLAFLAEHRGLDSSDLGVGFAEETWSFLDRQQRAGTLRSWLAESGRCTGVVSLLLFETAPVPGMRQTPDGYIINMYVEPTERGRGTGRALLDACREAAHEMGLRSLTLRATDAGRPLYLSAGFSTSGDWMELPL